MRGLVYRSDEDAPPFPLSRLVTPDARNPRFAQATLAPKVRNPRGRESGRGRQTLGLGQQSIEDLQSGVPETRVGDVHPQAPHQLIRPRRSAGGEELEVV